MEEDILIYLLHHEVVFPFGSETKFILATNMNDVFYPAADAEEVFFLDLEDLYFLHKKYDHLGVLFWAICRRGILPMRQMYCEDLKKAGLWTIELELLSQASNT